MALHQATRDPGAAGHNWARRIIEREQRKKHSSVTDFPVRMDDLNIRTAFSLSNIIASAPVAFADYIFADRSVRARAGELWETSKRRPTMKANDKRAILCHLVDKLRKHGSWCGETHVQKATYLLKHLVDVPIDFDFLLYKHGPFSFELRDELALLRSARVLELQPKGPYGPKLRVADSISTMAAERYQPETNLVAQTVGSRGASQLEALSTALLVTLDSPGDLVSRSDRLCQLKPHLKRPDAEQALHEIDRLRQDLPARLERSSAPA